MDHSAMKKPMDHSAMQRPMDHSAMKPDEHGGHERHGSFVLHGGMGAEEIRPLLCRRQRSAPKAANGGKFLSYADLKAQKPLYEHRAATREIEIRITGNMERYLWSLNDVKYGDAEPIRLKYGERVRFKFVNETMMTHPMHLHGMWSILDNGSQKMEPDKTRSQRIARHHGLHGNGSGCAGPVGLPLPSVLSRGSGHVP